MRRIDKLKQGILITMCIAGIGYSIYSTGNNVELGERPEPLPVREEVSLACDTPSNEDNIGTVNVDETSDFEFTIDEWQEYLDQQHVPNLDDILLNLKNKAPTVKQVETHQVEVDPQVISDYEEKMVASLKGVDLNPMYGKVLYQLNPMRSGTESSYTYGWSVGYGVTQINVKLIPLANLHYDDFETNYVSQFRFLNDYINAKAKRGLTVDQIVESYKLCIEH